METLPALARLYCSKELTHGLDKQIICLSVINTVLAIAAVVGNTVILIALHKETSLHRPSKALLRNLVASDLASVGFAELALVGKRNSILQEQWRVCRVFFYAQDMVVVISVWVSLGSKRGQTISSVVRNKVQANCNPQTSLCSCYHTLGFNRCWHDHSYDVESGCSKNCFSIGNNSVLDDIHLLLHRNFR